jgi:hypothetical protein
MLLINPTFFRGVRVQVPFPLVFNLLSMDGNAQGLFYGVFYTAVCRDFQISGKIYMLFILRESGSP